MFQKYFIKTNNKFLHQLILIFFYQLWVLSANLDKGNYKVLNEPLIIGFSIILIFVKIRAKKFLMNKQSKWRLVKLCISTIMIVMIVLQADLENFIEISIFVKGYFLGSQIISARISSKQDLDILLSSKNTCKLLLQLFITAAIIYETLKINRLTELSIIGVLTIYNLIQQIILSQCIQRTKSELAQFPLSSAKLSLAGVDRSPKTEFFYKYRTENDRGQFQDHQKCLHEHLKEPRSFFSSRNIQRKSVGPAQIQTKQLLETSFYKDILKSFSDGLMIMDANRKVLFVGQALNILMNTKNDNQAVKSLMALKNCQEEFFRQTKMANLFTNVIKKFNSRKNLSQNIEYEEYDDLNDPDDIQTHKINFNFESLVSESDTVNNEFEKIIYINKDDDEYNEESSALKFLYEVSMICSQDGELNKVDNLGSVGLTQGAPFALFQITLRPFIYHNKLQVLFIVKDVTHFNQIRVLQTVNENKSQMLYQVAHEFRTPLNCTILLIQELIVRSPEAIIDEYLKPILTSTKSLLSLIHDLLDLAQLKAGKFKLIYSEFNIFDLFNELKTFLQPNVQLKKNVLEIDIDQNLDSTFVSDPNRITQIIINLIGNSAKFTTNGTIKIGAQLVRYKISNYQSGDLMEVYVEDTGIGIDFEDQKALCQAFGKLEHGKEMNVQGVGLGLMISNILAERLSKSDYYQEFSPHSRECEDSGLKIQSEGRGKGSRFSFMVYRQVLSNSSKLVFAKTKQQAKKKLQEIDLSIMIYESQGNNDIYLSQSQKKESIYEKVNLTESINGSKKKLHKVQFDVPLITLSISEIKYQKSHFQLPKINKIQPFLEITDDQQKPGIQIYRHRVCDCPEILIVDDQAINIYALKMSLSKYKMKIDEANSGEEAIQKVLDFEQDYVCNMNFDCRTYQIILMDLEMQGQDGIKTTIDILKLNCGSLSNIIGCSAHEPSVVQQRCLDAGMIGYLTKPVNIPKLLSMIKNILG